MYLPMNYGHGHIDECAFIANLGALHRTSGTLGTWTAGAGGEAGRGGDRGAGGGGQGLWWG